MFATIFFILISMFGIGACGFTLAGIYFEGNGILQMICVAFSLVVAVLAMFNAIREYRRVIESQYAEDDDEMVVEVDLDD